VTANRWRLPARSERRAHHEAAGEWPQPNLTQLLVERARTDPDRLFVVDGDRRLSFRDFAAAAARLAAGLTRLGVGADDVVSWQLPSWWEAAVVGAAVDRVGAINNPIIPIYRESEVGFIARQAETRMLIVPGVFRGFDHRDLAREIRRSATSVEHVAVVRADPGDGMIAFDRLLDVAAEEPAPRDPYDVAMLFYTSGTTSEPKGVLHTASTMGAFARVNAAVSGARPDDVGLLQFPLTHIGGLAAFLILPILVGSRVVYLDVWDPERALSLIEREGVTSAGGPPAILRGILDARGFTAERVRTVRTAGTGAAGVPPELVREIRRRLGVPSFRSYGLTECPMLTSGRRDDAEEKCVNTDGRPSPGCRVRIVGASGEILPPGLEGEIEAFGPQMCVGYVDAELTREAFTPDGFLRTGDLGVVDPEGYVLVTGRRKDIIIRKGENLSAKAIEDVLFEHPGVADAAVVGVPDPATGERVCACLVMREGASPLTLDDLRSFMFERQIMRQKIPEQIEILPSLPRNATGKVMKLELRARLRRS
jgi:cyclohexanecarboxylate-CoA ligase